MRGSNPSLNPSLNPSPNSSHNLSRDSSADVRRSLEAVVAECQGNIAEAARRLGMARSTLRYRLGGNRAAPNPKAPNAELQLRLPGL